MYPYYKPAVVIGILSMLLYASTTMADAIVRSQAMFADLHGRPVLFSHPVYQYLQRRYAINGKSMLWEPDEEPSTPRLLPPTLRPNDGRNRLERLVCGGNLE